MLERVICEVLSNVTLHAPSIVGKLNFDTLQLLSEYNKLSIYTVLVRLEVHIAPFWAFLISLAPLIEISLGGAKGHPLLSWLRNELIWGITFGKCRFPCKPTSP